MSFDLGLSGRRALVTAGTKGVGVAVVEQRGDQAVLAVSDNGTQSPQPLASPSSGLGIGLTVVRRILELHGGHVRATSAGSDAGSEFAVSLPVSAAGTRADAGSENVVNTSAPLVALRARKVMIVDDHEGIRASVSRLAHGWGHEIAVAADGPSALSLAEAFQPECAIVDLSMQGMNGIELGRRLRLRFPQVQLRLIALSGYAGAHFRDACLAAGFDAYLVKPGDIPELERLLGGDPADYSVPRSTDQGLPDTRMRAGNSKGAEESSLA